MLMHLGFYCIFIMEVLYYTVSLPPPPLLRGVKRPANDNMYLHTCTYIKPPDHMHLALHPPASGKTLDVIFACSSWMPIRLPLSLEIPSTIKGFSIINYNLLTSWFVK
jgi:hypothetical protein